MKILLFFSLIFLSGTLLADEEIPPPKSVVRGGAFVTLSLSTPFPPMPDALPQNLINSPTGFYSTNWPETLFNDASIYSSQVIPGAMSVFARADVGSVGFFSTKFFLFSDALTHTEINVSCQGALPVYSGSFTSDELPATVSIDGEDYQMTGEINQRIDLTNGAYVVFNEELIELEGGHLDYSRSAIHLYDGADGKDDIIVNHSRGIAYCVK